MESLQFNKIHANRIGLDILPRLHFPGKDNSSAVSLDTVDIVFHERLLQRFSHLWNLLIDCNLYEIIGFSTTEGLAATQREIDIRLKDFDIDYLQSSCDECLALLKPQDGKYDYYKEGIELGNRKLKLVHEILGDPKKRAEYDENFLEHTLGIALEAIGTNIPLTQTIPVLLRIKLQLPNVKKLFYELTQEERLDPYRINDDGLTRLVTANLQGFRHAITEDLYQYTFTARSLSNEVQQAIDVMNERGLQLFEMTSIEEQGIPIVLTEREILCRFDGLRLVRSGINIPNSHFRPDLAREELEVLSVGYKGPLSREKRLQILNDGIALGLNELIFNKGVQKELQDAGKIPTLPEGFYYGKNGALYKFGQIDYSPPQGPRGPFHRGRTHLDVNSLTSQVTSWTEKKPAIYETYSAYPKRFTDELKALTNEYRKREKRHSWLGALWRK